MISINAINSVRPCATAASNVRTTGMAAQLVKVSQAADRPLSAPVPRAHHTGQQLVRLKQALISEYQQSTPGKEGHPLQARLQAGTRLYQQIASSGARRAFIGRMGTQRSQLLQHEQHKKGVLNSDVWSMTLNKAFIQGGIDVGATFYLWSDPSPREVALIKQAEQSRSAQQLIELVSREPAKDQLPVTWRSATEPQQTADLSVTAIEISQLQEGGYQFTDKGEQIPVPQYDRHFPAQQHYRYQFTPTPQNRQQRAIEAHIHRIRDNKPESTS